MILLCFFSIINIWIPFEQTILNEVDDSLVELSSLNNQNSDSLKRIIRKNGHFYYEGTNTRVRFFGTNVCFENAFPNKSLSMGIARRLSQLGINIVRFHHMDNKDIWNSDQTQISPTQLDRLHYFLYCLHQNGIYANINLHVSRNYKHFAFTDELKTVFTYGKALDRFFEPFIKDQIQYARDLIGSFNNYTQCKMADDTGVAFIELNNENSIFDIIEKVDYIRGTVFYDSISTQWRNYLSKKFKTVEAFSERINPYPINDSFNLVESNKLYISVGSSENSVENDDNFTILHIKKPIDSTYGIQIVVLEIKSFEKDTTYTVKFEGKACFPIDVSLGLQYSQPPWTVISTAKRFSITQEMKEYSILFTTGKNYDDSIPIQLSMTFNHSILNDYTISKPRIYKGSAYFNPSSNGTFEGVDVPSNKPAETSQFQAEYRLFLNEVQTTTQRRITDVLRNDLKTRALVTDSQATYGNYLNFNREYSHSDYLDIHYYWQHPNFVQGHKWDRKYFSINNVAMSDLNMTSGPFFSMLSFNARDRPFTISELNHPFPNEHQHETFPMIASWSAYHDFDAIYQFSYDQPNKPTNSSYVTGYFAMSTNPILMTTAPIAAVMFRSFGVKTANSSIVLKIPKKSLLQENEGRSVSAGELIGQVQRNFCWKPTYIEFTDDEEGEVKLSSNECENATRFPYQTEEIQWKKGLYVVNSEKVKAATGHISEVTFGSFNFSVYLENVSSNTATVAVTSLDFRSLEQSEKILLSVVGRTMNTGQEWNENKTSTGNSWGKAPVLVEYLKVSGSFVNGKNAKLIVLNKDGQFNGTLNLNFDSNKNLWSFESNESNPSIWYLITRDVDQNQNNKSKSKTGIIVAAVLIPVIVIAAIAVIVIVIVKRKNKSNSRDFSLL